jgi:hypothetical protein
VAEFSWAAAILVLLGGVYVLTRPRKTMAGDMDAPMDLERNRARSEAEMAAPVSDADEEAAAPLVAYVEEIGTGEFPTLAFAADPLGAPIPDGHLVEEEAFFHDLFADKISAFTWAATPGTTVALSSVQVVEPAPIDLESFTGSWTRAEFAALAARAETKAEASR